MIKVNVELGKNSYEIRIGSELLPRIGLWLKEKGFAGKAVIITDTNVRELYGDTLERSLTNASFKVTVLEVPAGEEQKTLANAGQLYQRLAESFAERTTPIVALGGGVIGDLAGFVASTYMRGVPFMQVPTSLLAMVDSAIGGKTAVNHDSLKNMVGTFYQPRFVVADVDTLKTLPEVELSNGMGEVIKHAVIHDKNFFSYLQNNMAAAIALNTDVLESIVEKNARIKAAVVGSDEKETGLRTLMNFGHTVGHAVEPISDFKIKHGQAVAIGMMAAVKISERIGRLPEDVVKQLEELIRKAGLPVSLPDLNDTEKEKLLELIKHDKKVQDGKIRFVLLKAIGSAFIDDKIDTGIIGEVLFGWKST
ncbi:MAG: 3-dehydroquinate synthase [Dehalococcoidales bacterium]